MRAKKAIISLMLSLAVGASGAGIQQVQAATKREVETLTRGLTVVGVKNGTLVSWRYLGTDSQNTTFELYRDNSLIYTSAQGEATCYGDTSGGTSSVYTLKVYKDGSDSASETAQTEYTLNYDKSANAGYFDIFFDAPKSDTEGVTYTANDASVADLDGDGQYELILKWDPSNSQDNSKDGVTSNVIIDAYELAAGSAERLWRIDLGKNIRAGAHYTQFMVYDLDCDGTAEMVCKTAPGSKDGQGSYVTAASSVSAIKNASDNEVSYVNSAGRILSGSEYLTLFDGKTGKALDTIYYEPSRGTVSAWGDSYGNRVDRFLGGIAYLDGKTPSVLMCRGYYTRSVIAAYDVKNKKLSKRWIFDTDDSGNSDFAGQGNHSLATADVDGDGCDEIVYGSMTVDNDGTGLYTNGLGHGDALHVGDLLPKRDGLEIYQVYEDEPTWGASLKDAKTGEMIKYWQGSKDIGRGVGDNLIAGNDSAEFSCVIDSVVYDGGGNTVCNWSDITKWGQNSLIYWDGDLEREVLDRCMIDGYGKGRLSTGSNVDYNNGSKSNVCISADIFGDWREEYIARLADGTGVRVYATSYATDYRLYTLMHNTQYRCGVAAENVGYNQPPHVDYWLGTGSALPSQPNVHGVLDPEVMVCPTFTNNCYDPSLYSGKLTYDSSLGGAYCLLSGTAAGDGNNCVTFDNTDTAFVDGSDTGAVTNYIMPLPDNGNIITVTGSFKLGSAKNKWTFLQLKGKKTDGTNAELAAVRTYGGTYRFRTETADDKDLTDTGASVSTDTMGYKLVINKLERTAEITIGGKTAKIPVDCAELRELRFITVRGSDSLYAGSVNVSYTLMGDADSNGTLDEADVAAILKYIGSKSTVINTVLADINADGSVDLKDCLIIEQLIQ